VKDSKESHKLGELAQVLPKGGRMVMVLVGEKDVSYFPSDFSSDLFFSLKVLIYERSKRNWCLI